MARKLIESDERLPLTLEEGLAIATQHPEWLLEKNGFNLLGSRSADGRVPSIWMSQSAPRLGAVWPNSRHTWLGQCILHRAPRCESHRRARLSAAYFEEVSVRCVAERSRDGIFYGDFPCAVLFLVASAVRFSDASVYDAIFRCLWWHGFTGSFREICRRGAPEWHSFRKSPYVVPWQCGLVVCLSEASVRCAAEKSANGDSTEPSVNRATVRKLVPQGVPRSAAQHSAARIVCNVCKIPAWDGRNTDCRKPLSC